MPFAFGPTVCACECLLERCNPSTENEFFVAANKQMHVIRHYDVTPNCDIEFSGAVAEFYERAMCLLRPEDSSPTMRAKGNKVDRRIISLKNFVDSRRTMAEFSKGHVSG